MSFRIPSRGRAILSLLCALFLLCAPDRGMSQTLGIDCDQPKRNADGKLILNDDGSGKALCEAERATALNYAAIVSETRDRVRSALSGLPPPLWDDLVAHLRTSDVIDDWTYGTSANEADILEQIKAYSTSAPAGAPGEITPPNRAYEKANARKDGLLTRTSYPDDWRGIVKARACGVNASGTVRNGAAVLIWLDPGSIRPRWTPEMVQRTVRVWRSRQYGFNPRDETVPEIVTGTGRLKDWQGNTSSVSSDATIRDCFFSGANAVPEGALALRIPLRRDIDTGRAYETCAGAGTGTDRVGARHLMWVKHNGVYIVPDTALIDPPVDGDGDGKHDPHPDRGDPLLDPPVTDETAAWHLTHSTCRTPRTINAVRPVECDATINGRAVKGTHIRTYRFREVQNDPDDAFRIDMVPVGPGNGELGAIAPAGEPHPIWSETTLFCDGAIPESKAPDIPEPEPDRDWDIPDCAEQHGEEFKGKRLGYRQTITYPEGWPVRDVEVRTIDDDCFDPDLEDPGTEVRPGPNCPEGHSGEIVEGRDLSWWIINWAEPSRHGDPWVRQLAEAAAAFDSGTALFGPPVTPPFNGVTLDRDWHVDKLTCKAPVRITDTRTRAGSCPAGQVGLVTESRTLSWYNRDPGAVPPHVITDREVDEAAASYDADPGQTGLPWFRKVTATPWRETRNTCRPARTCGNTCAERGGVETRNSEGEECVSPKLPKCSTSGIKSGNDSGKGDQDFDGFHDDVDADPTDPNVDGTNGRSEGNTD